MSIPINEQETTINIYRDRSECDIWTSDTTMMTKLDRLCEKSPQYYKLVEVGNISGVITDKDYRIKDKSLISFRSGKVVLSDEQKQERAERMQKNRESKSVNDL